jgi:hypothetical protein
MRHFLAAKRLFVVSLLVFFLGFNPGEGFVKESFNLIETLGDKGHIDWTTGVVTATGRGSPPEKHHGTPQARFLSERAALLDAQRNLFELARGVQIDSRTTVGKLMAQDEAIEVQVREMVKGAETVKKEYLSDGTVEVAVNLGLYGGFAQLVLPKDVKQLPEIKAIVYRPASSPEDKKDGGPKNAAAPGDEAPVETSNVCSGLVIDARGLTGRPAMLPRILDENGEEVYGSAYVSRDVAVQNGVAGYTTDPDAARGDSRVGAGPFSVKGLGPTIPGGPDFIISNSDASRIRSSSENLSMLRQCRVLIVLD